MVSYEGTVKVVDFGVAKAENARDRDALGNGEGEDQLPVAGAVPPARTSIAAAICSRWASCCGRC